MADNDDGRVEKKSENPGGVGFPEDPNQLNQSYGRNVQPDRAEDAAERATSDLPVNPEEIREQSGYTDMTVDVAQEAGEAELEAEGREPASGETPPRAFPDAKP